MKNLLGKSLIFSTLLKTIKEKGAAHILLLDPDKRDEESIEERVKSANNSGVDALLVGCLLYTSPSPRD